MELSELLVIESLLTPLLTVIQLWGGEVFLKVEAIFEIYLSWVEKMISVNPEGFMLQVTRHILLSSRNEMVFSRESDMFFIVMRLRFSESVILYLFTLHHPQSNGTFSGHLV